MGRKSKKRMPDRWTDYKAMGDVIPGTQFIAFKVPLKVEYFDRHGKSVERFTTEDLLRTLKSKLAVVIDLSYKDIGSFYDPQDLEENGIKYEKLFTAGHVVPKTDLVKRFTSIVKDTLMHKPKDKLIGVHCTHGVNRTGYMITRYMVEHLNFTAEDAQKAFEKGRGYPMERENYIESLQLIEKSLKDGTFIRGTTNEIQETKKCSIPSETKNDRQYQSDSYSDDYAYQMPYYDEYYKDQSYGHEFNNFSGTRPSSFLHSHQRTDFSDQYWYNCPPNSSFRPHRGYEEYGDSGYHRRNSRYNPYQYNKSKYHWSKKDSTTRRPSTQHEDRNVWRRNPQRSHIHFNY